MLVMSRRAGETILIGDDIEVLIAHIGRTRVKVGIRAPREKAVMALEWKLVKEENTAAAGERGGPPALPQLAARLRAASNNAHGCR